MASEAAPVQQVVAEATGAPVDALPAVSDSVLIQGPPPPVPPEVQTRDSDGGATIRAIRLAAPLQFDGRLDEAVHEDVPQVTGFYQVLPDAGEPASEPTDVWMLFDTDDVYISARIWQANMADSAIAAELVRNERPVRTMDSASRIDTFYDRQTGYLFYTNPIGAIGDCQVGELPGLSNCDYNPVWDGSDGALSGRLDARDKDSVQEPEVSIRPGAGVGHSVSPSSSAPQ